MAYIRTKKVKGREYQFFGEQQTIKYLGTVTDPNSEEDAMVKTQVHKDLTFEEYLNYDDGTNNRYELVDGELVLMPPASFLHSDIIDFIADCFKAIASAYQLDIKIKSGDVGVKTGIKSSRIPDVAVVDGEVWRSYPRESSAVIQVPLMLAVEFVSPGSEQIERDYTDKASEYQETGIPEYWIVDSIEQKITVLVLDEGSYTKTIFTGDETVSSITFPELKLTAAEILSA